MRRAVIFLALVFPLITACARNARDYIARGNKFFDAGKYENASLEYQKALQKEPNSGEALYRLALVKMEQGKGLEAYDPLMRAVELMPASEPAKIKLADLSLALYVVDPSKPKVLHDQIDKLSGQLLAKNPNSYDGLRLKGAVRLLDRDAKGALECFEQANRVQPMQPPVIQSMVQALFAENRTDEGERLAWQLIEKNKSFGPMYDTLYQHYLSDGRPAEAEKMLLKKVENNPKESSYILQLAAYYWQTKRPADTDRTLHRLLDNAKDFPKARIQAGDFYAGAAQWDRAIQLFQEAANSIPSEKNACRQRIADALLAQGKREEAAKTVDLILKDDPKNEEARRVHATLLMESGKPEDAAMAKTELEALAKTRPNDARVRFSLARTHMVLGNIDAARSEFREVLRIRTDDLPSRFALAAISMNQRKPTEALRYADEILSYTPDSAPAKLLRISAMTAAGYYAEAHRDLARLSQQFPQNREVDLAAGTLAVAEKKYGEAEKIFRKLYQPGSSDIRPAAALVETWSAQNQFDKALDLLNSEKQKSPQSMPVRNLLATTAMRAGKYDLAVTELQQLIAQDPKSVELHRQLALAYIAKADSNSAVTQFEEARRLAPADPESTMLLATALEKAGRPADAKAQYQALMKQLPDNPSVLNNMAFLLAENGGSLDEALGLAQRALQKVPGQPNYTDTLGWIYLKKGMKQSAVQTFSNLVRQQPKNPTFRYHLGLALLENGDPQKAREQLQQALASAPAADLREKIKAAVSKIG